jgi:hypothetical protein
MHRSIRTLNNKLHDVTNLFHKVKSGVSKGGSNGVSKKDLGAILKLTEKNNTRLDTLRQKFSSDPMTRERVVKTLRVVAQILHPGHSPAKIAALVTSALAFLGLQAGALINEASAFLSPMNQVVNGMNTITAINNAKDRAPELASHVSEASTDPTFFLVAVGVLVGGFSIATLLAKLKYS